MKRGSIQPYGASAWQSKAALKKLRFTRVRTAPGPLGPPKIRFFARRRRWQNRQGTLALQGSTYINASTVLLLAFC